jgi:hypothetical protein
MEHGQAVVEKLEEAEQASCWAECVSIKVKLTEQG